MECASSSPAITSLLSTESPIEPLPDNNVEPSSSVVLLDLGDKKKRHAIEVVIPGHVHTLLYNAHDKTKTYGLLSTTHVRHSCADMFLNTPTDEYPWPQ